MNNNEIFTIAEYLKLLNENLEYFSAKITGEVTEFKVSTKGHIYFTLKDKQEECVINCLMWQSNYRLCGIEIKQGLEIIVSGYPNIYEPLGKLTFKAETIELKGLGPLKKAYEALKKKLSQEGLFAKERKRPIPLFPQKIGVITSKKGAVIDDFLNNLSQYGFRVILVDARVEGQEASKEIYWALKKLKKIDIEVLVIMRGGGSLESLQAFNNELLVREVAGFPKPVIAAIGHDKDVPLVSLAADVAVSTPTAAAMALNKTWNELAYNLPYLSQRLIDSLGTCLQYLKNEIEQSSQQLIEAFKNQIKETKTYLQTLNNYLKAVDPRTNLKMGYSIVFSDRGVVKEASQLKEGEEITTKFYRGQTLSKIKKVIPQNL